MTILEKINNNREIGGFTSEAEFLASVAEIENNTVRIDLPLNKIDFSSDEEEISIIFNGTTYPLRPNGVKTLSQRLGIGGPVLELFTMEELIDVFRLCTEKHTNGETAIMVKIGEKVSAVLSDGYKIIFADKIFEEASSAVKKLNGEFVGGFISEDKFLSSYILKDEKIISSYKDKFEENDYLSGAIPLVTVETSNTGFSSVTITPKFLIKNREVIIGKSLRAMHKGNNDMNTVTENFNQIFAVFKAAIDGLQSLKKIKLEYPSNTFKNICKRLILPKKYSMLASVDFDDFIEDMDVVTAYDIYIGLTEILFHAENDGRGKEFINNLQELIARALFVDYRKYDIPYSEW